MPKSPNLKWIMARVERCEAQIWETARAVAATGTDVVLDLGFTQRAKRIRFLELAEARGLDTRLHYLTAPHALRRARVLKRNVGDAARRLCSVTVHRHIDLKERERHFG